jgi:DNA polymerase-3 subunit alpha
VNKDGDIQAGFCFIKNLGDGAIQEILKKRPFKNLKDFLLKVSGKSVNKSAILALIHSGCFDFSLEIKNRSELNKRFELVNEYLKYKKDKELGLVPLNPTAIMAITQESEVNGGELFNSIIHLIDVAAMNKEYAVDDRVIKVSDLDKINPGTTVRIVGVVSSFKTMTSKSGNPIGFLNLSSMGKSVKLNMWKGEVATYNNSDEIKQALIPGSVITCRVKRSNDYMGSKSFMMDFNKMKKLI